MRPYDERLDHFLSRAAKVFADQGYHSTTMRDLAAATDMSLAGMYYYVRGKEELLFRIQERCFMRGLAGAERARLRPAAAEPASALAPPQRAISPPRPACRPPACITPSAARRSRSAVARRAASCGCPRARRARPPGGVRPTRRARPPRPRAPA